MGAGGVLKGDELITLAGSAKESIWSYDMYEELLEILSKRPEPYMQGERKFWNDEHISKNMLATHLDPKDDLATRKPAFVQKSADWIAGLAAVRKSPRLLDLGCGPGIYAESFAQRGFAVKGLDISPRSIAYARESAAKKGLDIEYVCGSYLEEDFTGPFDVITLIYFDFGVLCGRDRETLLRRIYGALSPGGVFIFDALAPPFYSGKEESTNWSFCEGGFWSEKPYAAFYSFLRYDECRVYCDRYVVTEKGRLRQFNIWNHAFDDGEILFDLSAAGFARTDIYGDAAGAAYTLGSPTICAAAYKE